jgi:predicted ATPase
MLLTKIKVKNFLSVNGQCELPIDSRVTVLLGANDHGKSNLLRALRHLNLDAPILEDEENWDSKDPQLEFLFRISAEERQKLDALMQKYAQQLIDYGLKLDAINAEFGIRRGAESNEAQAPVEARIALPAAAAKELDKVKKQIESVTIEIGIINGILEGGSISLCRNGIEGKLSVLGWELDQLEDETLEVLRPMIPRVELFEAFSGQLQDSVTADQIEQTDFEFIQGIFYYAGLDPLHASDLFEQNDETDKTLEDASVRLDRELRKLWGQGVDLNLHFQLKHKGDSIELYAKDPAVKRRHARMSKRSAGVTQFFRLSMVLHARRMKNPANSYIYLFDEPGVFLHPKGQKDLMAVLEQLAGETQIIYATHSLFMLNQNFPERHRLIARNASTTLVDAKPYRANWKYAVDALGVHLTANILFSPNVLLVEGDSDPLYIYELLRALNQLGETDADANLIGITSYCDLPNLRFLIQTFKGESKERTVAALFEGDKQGRDYQRAAGNLCKAHDVRVFSLGTGSAIEDYCLHPKLFLDAVEATLLQSFEATGAAVPDDLTERITKSWEAFTNSRSSSQPHRARRSNEQKDGGQDGPGQSDAEPKERNEETTNAGRWFKEMSETLVGDGGASKVALARNYVFLSRENRVQDGLDPKRVELAKALLDPIITALKLPSTKAKQAFET